MFFLCRLDFVKDFFGSLLMLQDGIHKVMLTNLATNVRIVYYYKPGELEDGAYGQFRTCIEA